jgi:hypothetical protein
VGKVKTKPVAADPKKASPQIERAVAASKLATGKKAQASKAKKESP